MTELRSYIRDGAEIYRNSFAIIRAEANLSRFKQNEEKLAVRIIHACGMVDISAVEMQLTTVHQHRANAAVIVIQDVDLLGGIELIVRITANIVVASAEAAVYIFGIRGVGVGA